MTLVLLPLPVVSLLLSFTLLWLDDHLFFAAASFCFFAAAALHLLWLFGHIFSASFAQWNVPVNESESLSVSAFSIGLFFLLVCVEFFFRDCSLSFSHSGV